jgi:hypothetical protein
MKASTIIPPITDPLGRYWEQPDLNDIEIITDFALMTEDTLQKLHTYSTTLPSGTYDGKVWKSEIKDVGGWAGKYKLNWFHPNDDPKQISISRREIKVLDDFTFRKLFKEK